jgi:DNA-binding ferritin-like protein
MRRTRKYRCETQHQRPPHEGEELPITTRIYAAVDTIRTVHDDVDAADPSSADLLHEIIDDMEKAAWMLKSENRKI